MCLNNDNYGWFDLKENKLCPQHDGIEIDCFEIYRKE